MKAYLKHIDDVIEEKVTLITNNVEVVCFAGVCPFEIQVGQEYSVSFEMNVFSDYHLEKSASKETGVTRLGNSFQYLLRGKLNGNTVLCGLPFEDEILRSNYGYLDGDIVDFIVDRIDVEFF